MAVKGGASALIVDGEVWQIDAEAAKASHITTTHESIIGGAGMVGTTEKGKAAFIEVKVFRDESQSWDSLKGDKDSVILRTPSADTTIGPNAKWVGDHEEASSDVSATVRFEAPRGKQVKA